MPAINTAFKEWNAVCRALAAGRQALIVRKGGIHEEGGVFRPEYGQFWLYPTRFHEQPDLLKPGADPAGTAPPPPGVLILDTYIDVEKVYYLESLEAALALAGEHIWSEQTIRERFSYRKPGLYILAARAYTLDTPIELVERPEYAGCKTWVALDPAPRPGAADAARPALDDAAFAAALARIEAAVSSSSERGV